MGVLEKVLEIRSDLQRFVSESNNLMNQFSEIYDASIRDAYYALSDQRRTLGSRIAILRVHNGWKAVDDVEKESSFMLLRQVDSQLTSQMVVLQDAYLKKYLKLHERKIFDPPLLTGRLAPSKVVSKVVTNNVRYKLSLEPSKVATLVLMLETQGC